ncbi:MAG: glycosyltransferase family 4 protein [Candidatus Magnetoovum sp. WYHC-5]|nr:glycosyltransferase family 4 protein [Candidatus Magnetoovum sp. WYHC-5]
MSILILCAGSPGRWSGIEMHCLSLSKGLKKLGYDVYIGCHKDGYVKKQAVALGLKTKNIRIANAVDILGLIKVAKAVYDAQIKYVVINYGRDYWPIIILSKMLNIKSIVIRHQMNRLKNKTNRLLNRYAGKVVAVSNAVRDVLLKSDIAYEKVAVIHNGIDIERFNPDRVNVNDVRAELGIKDGEILIGTACRLKKEKGVYELLEAFNILYKQNNANIRLMYVGDGPEMVGLKERSVELNLISKILLLGYRDDMEKLYAAMDVFVLSSTSYESFGLVIAEAMAMKTPVVATATGGVCEIIEHNRNGLLVDIKDVVSLANSIERLIKDKELYNKFIMAGRKMVEERFTQEKMATAFVKCLVVE